MVLIDLNGGWKMKRTDQNDWIRASVPGSVYSDLLQNNRMEDPFYRENEYAATDLCRFDYEYTRSFSVSDDLLSHDKIVLLCEGLDTLCDVWLNGTQLFHGENMHRIYEHEVGAHLVNGENTLRIVFRSPITYCEEKQKIQPLFNSRDALPGISYLRKAHCMSGWDWGPKLPDMGIWRSISLRGYDRARIDDVYITQHHESGKAELEIQTNLIRFSRNPLTLKATVQGPDGFLTEATADVTESHETIRIAVDHPQLWWPNNLGAQPLYTVSVSLLTDGRELDTQQKRIGLRTMTVTREKDRWGESFAFTVNGTPVFAMGADYVPEDNILSRCSRERTEKLIRSCVQANFNCIRVWGGQHYPEDYFFDLCDEYGLVVWHDLMYACGVYELTNEFKENIRQETIDNVKRIRHHASLGLWCGNNEQEVGWYEWGWSETHSPRLKADYIKMYEVLLPDILTEYDPNTFYWPASPSSGGGFDEPNGQDRGDMHYWAVWHGLKPFTDYRNIFPRFMSEFGLQSFPGMKTVKTFTLPSDRDIFSPVMESHQKNSVCNAKILHYVSENYRYPKDFDSLLYASQLIQAEGMRYGVEHWRRNRDRCMGTVYWQLNDCWPVASWSSIDYYGRWKALHYAARRFFAPVLLSACEEGTQVSLHLSNESRENICGRIVWELLDPACRVLESGSAEASAASFSSLKCLDLDFAQTLDTVEKQRNALLAFRFETEDGVVSAGTVMFVKSKHFSFLDPKISLAVEEYPDRFAVSVSSEAFAHFVELDLQTDDAVFSDNYFDLTGSTKRVEVLKSDISSTLSADEFRSQLTVRSLYDASATY